MTNKIKRSLVALYLDVDPPNEDYALIGDGVTTLQINANPQITTEQYIHQNQATTFVEAYQPTAPVEMTCKEGDDVFEFVNGLWNIRATLEDAESSIVEVDLYEVGGPSAYPARQQAVSISVDNPPGGEGGKAAKMSFTLNYVGDKVLGTFNAGTGAFTPSGSGS